MKPYRLFLFSLSLAMACQGTKTKPADTAVATIEEAKNAILESNRLYFEAFVNGDSSLFIDRYSSDACIMAPSSPALCGEQAASSFYRIAYQQLGIRNGKFTTQAVYGSGNYVVEEGLFDLQDGQNSQIDRGKYLVLWKKTAKGWKMFRDSFSSNQKNNS